MLPILLAAIADGPDPGHALNRFSDIVERLSSGVNLYRLLEARPALAKILSQILVHAPALADQLARRPGLLDGLIDESSFAAPPDAATVAGKLAEGMARASYDERLDRVRRLRVAVDGAPVWPPGVRVVAPDVLELPEGLVATLVLDAARAAGRVREFAPVQPSLTELFREVVQA